MGNIQTQMNKKGNAGLMRLNREVKMVKRDIEA